MTDSEYVDEEVQRLSSAVEEQAPLSSDSFWKSIEKLFSKPALTVDVDDTVGAAIKQMRETEYGAVVVTRKGKLFSKPALTVDVDDTVGEAIKQMRETEYGAVVVTRKGKLAGLITERDLICSIIGVIDDFENARVGDVMLADPVRLRSSDPIVYVLHNMQVEGYRHVPIVDEQERPVSVVSIKDVARYILGHFPEDVINVTPEPYRGPPSREGA